MPWLLLDVAAVLLALGAAGACGLRLWRGVRALSRELGRAGSEIGAASDALAAVQSSGPGAPGGPSGSVPVTPSGPGAARHQRPAPSRERRR